jgi:cobalt-zinc-cadmium efflux system membrane fusion protein
MARRRIVGILGWVAGRIPTLLAWAGLGGLFVFGAMNGWKFGDEQAKKDEKAKKDEHRHGDDDEPFTPYYQPQPFDVPVQVTHDPKHCPNEKKTVTLKSPEAVARAGIRTAPVGYDWVTVTLEAHGEVAQDPTAMAKASPRVGGVLFALEKQLGDPVKKGELLALVDSADVGKAKAAYLTARAMVESRETILDSLRRSTNVPQRTVVEAEATAREARAGLYSARQGLANLGLPLPSAEDEKLTDESLTSRLLLLGVPEAKRRELEARATATGEALTANLLPVFSPLDGVVTKRSGVVGETIAALVPVYEVGDPTKVYIFLDVRQEDMPRVTLGQELTFRLEGGADVPSVDGVIDWISPTVDEKTRTVRARGRVSNPNGVLKSGAFGGGTVTVEGPRPALVVPREAVHWEGCKHVVFAKRTADGTTYYPLKVTLGARCGDMVEVTGIDVGEEIAVAGSHVLKAELLKDRIGQAEE